MPRLCRGMCLSECSFSLVILSQGSERCLSKSKGIDGPNVEAMNVELHVPHVALEHKYLQACPLAQPVAIPAAGMVFPSVLQVCVGQRASTR